MKFLTICQTGLKLAQREKRYEDITKRKTTA